MVVKVFKVVFVVRSILCVYFRFLKYMMVIRVELDCRVYEGEVVVLGGMGGCSLEV